MSGHMLAVLIASSGFIAAPRPAAPAKPVDWLSRFAPAAVRYWGNGQLPPCGKPTFTWAPTTASQVADADPASCVIRFNPPAWPRLSGNTAWLCRAVFHETGHLYGHTHDEGGIMDGGTAVYTIPFAPCDRLLGTAR